MELFDNFLKDDFEDFEEEEDEKIGEILQYPKISDMIYKENIKEIMNLIIKKARKKRINLLLYGQQGTGKTTSAKMIACETNRPFIYINGNMTKKRIIDILLKAKENSIILVDEIHNISESIGEVIYPAIQDNEVYLDGKKIELELMFIATTTEPQELAKPLRDRFKEIELEELEKEQLKQVLKNKGCNDKVSDYLLNFTTNIRIINNLLEMINLYGDYTEENLIKVFRLKRINLYSGLSDIQEEYLKVVKRLKKVGCRIISLFLRKSEDYIKYEIEPDLIKKGYIIITSRGREISPDKIDVDFNFKEIEVEDKKFKQDEREIAIRFLNEHQEIKQKFSKNYLELVNWLAEKIASGIMPDEIDVESWGNDKEFEDSFQDNYLDL